MHKQISCDEAMGQRKGADLPLTHLTFKALFQQQFRRRAIW
jgi:hypothetical protein